MGAARARSSRRQPPGEFELLARVRAAVEAGGPGRGVIVGIGDDCAVVEAPRGGQRLVLTTDTMVEGVHFRSSWLTPRELGVRAFRAAVSDIAAMGAKPRYVLVSLEIPGDERGFGAGDALALVRAAAADARRTGASVVGGNVSGSERTAVSVTVVGETIGKPLLRRGARAGDLVFVTGSLGGSAAGCRVLLAARDVPAIARAYRRPPLRLAFAAALAQSGLARAMIDVSDGLLQDLGHIADESRVAIRVDPASVPIHPAAKKGVRPLFALELALAGGEDYELAFTAPKSARGAIEKLAARHRTPVSEIGFIDRGRPGVTDAAGRPFSLSATGFDHLRGRARGARASRR